jgi:hypothetical protein
VRDQSTRRRLVGAWRLRAWETTAEDGAIDHPMGEDPVGIVIYTDEGTMVTILARADRAPFAGADLLGGSVEEKVAALETFVSYASTWRLEGDEVIHTVVVSLFPNWVGTQQRRRIELSEDGGTLTLRSPAFLLRGAVRSSRVVWERGGF